MPSLTTNVCTTTGTTPKKGVQLERGLLGHNYIVSTNFENVLSQLYTTVVTSKGFWLYVGYKL